MKRISALNLSIYTFAALIVHTAPTKTININDRALNDYCAPGELFVYRSTTPNMRIKVYNGRMYLSSSTIDNTQQIIDSYTEIKRKKVLLTNDAVQHATTDGVIDVATAIMQAPEADLKAYRMMFTNCFIEAPVLRLQPTNPRSIVNEIIVIFDANATLPPMVQGFIDFQEDEPTGEILLAGVSEVQISFKPEAFNKPTRRKLDSNYGTHMTSLITVASNTTGPILEMGAGDYSTPLLHAVCSKDKRYLLSTDTDQGWLSLFTDLENDWHKFQYVNVYEDDWSINPKPHLWDAIGGDTHWAMVFIDHRPGERRIVDVERLRNNTDIFVIHDTETEGYGYEPVLSSFKYKYVDTRYATQTTVVSDTINVREFFTNN
jgi:hypothetical protein